MMRKIPLLSMIVLASALSACAASTPPLPMSQPVASGYFTNKGMTLAAADGSFSFTGGAPFTPPFQTDMYCATCSKEFYGQPDLLDPNQLLAAGAKRVVLTTDDGTKLYGLLLLNRVFGPQAVGANTALYTFYSPSLRSYELSIPQDRIEQAKSGRTSVSYEIFANLPADRSVTGQERTYRSWVLLLSRDPL